MTDELDDVQPDDATGEPGVPEPIAQLGIEAQAEYLRTRQRLGLADVAAAQLGTVGRYQLEREVGRGGMGIVYRARDPELDRPVAIKLVQAHPFVHYDKLRARLLREAKVLAKLTHPNVIRIYDFGEHQGEVYLAMEYVEGATLRQWQREQTHRAILDAYVHAARGLAAAHELGITHRDFKPDNVLMAEDGRVLVGDFGLAGVSVRAEVRDDKPGAVASKSVPGVATRTGTLLGTLTYMAPEQLRGEGATALSDQFAYCVSLWEALAGKRPFEAETKDGLLEQIGQGQVVGADRVTRRLRGRLLRGLAMEPAARFGGVEELADAIRPRQSRAVIVVVFVLTLAAGLVLGRLGTEPRSLGCTHLQTAILEVEAMPEWSELQNRLDGSLHHLYASLRDNFDDIEERARDICSSESSDDFDLRMQHIDTRLTFLRQTLESSSTRSANGPYQLGITHVLDAIEQIENQRWTAPPPQPLSNQFRDKLKTAQSFVLENMPEAALNSIDEAIDLAGKKDLELAHAYRWRGRILALLMGKHHEALSAYGQAVTHAISTDDDDVTLEIELLIAKTAAMRMNDLDRAKYALNHAEGLLNKDKKPWLRIRSADYHEISAAILKRQKEYDKALKDQTRALNLRYLRPDIRRIGSGHVNLGTIYEWRNKGEDMNMAGIHYERALNMLTNGSLSQCPEWLEAAYNFGHWLVMKELAESEHQEWSPVENPRWDRALRLLQDVVSRSDDLKIHAMTDLLLMSIVEDNASETASLARGLTSVLPGDPAIIQSEQFLDAWQNIAIAHAINNDVLAFSEARDRFIEGVLYVRKHETAEQLQDAEEQSIFFEIEALGRFIGHDPNHPLARELAQSIRSRLRAWPESELKNQILSEID